MDPRLKKYSEIIGQYEFCQWKPIENRYLELKEKINYLLDKYESVFFVDSIKIIKNKCYACLNPNYKHSCPLHFCDVCKSFHDEVLQCCAHTSDYYRYFSNAHKFNQLCNEADLFEIRCYNCRKLAGNCKGECKSQSRSFAKIIDINYI